MFDDITSWILLVVINLDLEEYKVNVLQLIQKYMLLKALRCYSSSIKN